MQCAHVVAVSAERLVAGRVRSRNTASRRSMYVPVSCTFPFMANSPSNKARIDERRFPVRVRVAVPEGGFGKRMDDMVCHLDDVTGRGRWARHPAGRDAILVDATFFYFADVAAAAVFLEAFGLETVEADMTLDGGSSDKLLHLHGVPGANRTRIVRYGQ